MSRDPSTNPTPLDKASFYIESLKYGPGPGAVEGASLDEVVGQLDCLLRDAQVDSMSGQQLRDALEYYVQSFVRQFGLPPLLIRSLWCDGLMHGIALAGGITGEHRNPVGQ